MDDFFNILPVVQQGYIDGPLIRPTGVDANHFHRQVRAGKCRNFSNIVGRRHFDDIHSHQVDSHKTADNRHRLESDQPALDRRTRAGRIARVQTIDVEGQVDGLVSEHGSGLTNNGIDAVFMNPGSVENVESQRVFVARA